MKIRGRRASKKYSLERVAIRGEIVSHEEERFSIIQQMDGIEPRQITESLRVDLNRKKVFEAGEGSGQSGSLFFYSRDNRFVIKTLRGSEKKKLLDMLDAYIDHIKRTKNKSMLVRIYGIFTFKTSLFDDLDVIILQNACQFQKKDSQRMVFDLKGSRIGRYTKLPDEHLKFWRQEMNFHKTLKDNNLVEITQDSSNGFLQFDVETFEAIRSIVNLDSEFLNQQGLMDYSLLLAVETIIESDSGVFPSLSINKRAFHPQDSQMNDSSNSFELNP
jgi:1-phosphatidylinositol-4-phosphate 5-kinase